MFFISVSGSGRLKWLGSKIQYLLGGDILDGFECVFLRDGNTDDCHSDCSNCGYYGDCSICANYDVCDFNSHDTMCSDFNRC